MRHACIHCILITAICTDYNLHVCDRWNARCMDKEKADH